jgi:hypothetical protein
MNEEDIKRILTAKDLPGWFTRLFSFSFPCCCGAHALPLLDAGTFKKFNTFLNEIKNRCAVRRIQLFSLGVRCSVWQEIPLVERLLQLLP